MSSETTNIHHGADAHEETLTVLKIKQVALILVAITVVEFIFALGLAPHFPFIKQIVNPIYIVLTLVKAFFIVAYFMHLKFENKALIYIIIVPIIFILGLIFVLTNESHHWIDLRG